MSSESVIKAENLGKAYHIFKQPQDRLKQMLCFGRKKFYEEYWALRSVSFDISPGEAVAFVGRNGAGKSTLLQLICGILEPSEGNIVTMGRVAALLELGAGFNPEFTGKENITLAASLLGLTNAEIQDRFQSIIEFAGLGDFINQPVKLYSSGMFARLAFAVAAHVDADIFVIDEILAVGDAAFTQKCATFLHRFRKKGTLLFVSHDISSVTAYCDRAIWLENGYIREDAPAKEVAHNYMAAIESEKADSRSFQIGGTRNRPKLSPKSNHTQKVREISTNQIEFFNFDPHAKWFGYRGGTIEDVRFITKDGATISTLEGGEDITLSVLCSAQDRIRGPIVGYYIKNSQGLFLFGDNTYVTYKEAPLEVGRGEFFTTTFTFQMPFLPNGTYSVVTALSEGTQQEHINHHWYDDALFFYVNSSHVCGGLIGLPMLDIQMEIVEPVAKSVSG